MTQQERNHTAKVYKEMRRILWMHKHEQQSWEDIKFFMHLSFAIGIVYAIYKIITIKGYFGW